MIEKLDGVAPLIADPPPTKSTTMHKGLFAKTEIYVLALQPICPVQQNTHYFWTNNVIFKYFRI